MDTCLQFAQRHETRHAEAIGDGQQRHAVIVLNGRVHGVEERHEINEALSGAFSNLGHHTTSARRHTSVGEPSLQLQSQHGRARVQQTTMRWHQLTIHFKHLFELRYFSVINIFFFVFFVFFTISANFFRFTNKRAATRPANSFIHVVIEGFKKELFCSTLLNWSKKKQKNRLKAINVFEKPSLTCTNHRVLAIEIVWQQHERGATHRRRTKLGDERGRQSDRCRTAPRGQAHARHR